MKVQLPPIRAMLRFGLLSCSTLLSGLLLVCLVIRFVIKDTLAELAFAYYAAPLPILACMALLLGVLWWFSRRTRFAQFCFVFALGALCVWSYESFSLNAKRATPDNVKVLFWNAASNRETTEIAHYVSGFDADLIGMVEAGVRSKNVSTWQNIFPNQRVEKLGGNMALITKGRIISKETGSLGGRGRFNLLEVEIRRERVYVLLVDFDSDPFRSRSPAFAPLLKMIHAYAHTNLVVMGDFNTPLDSIFFEAFHPHLNHAFESAGNGFAESWPLPLPMLMIDHIWVSKKIAVVNCNLNWSRYSDHRPVVANLALPVHTFSEKLIK